MQLLHRFYAWVFRYFWLPCPLCGEYTGGHQWKDRDGKSSVLADGRGICPRCTKAGRGSRVLHVEPSEADEDHDDSDKAPSLWPVAAGDVWRIDQADHGSPRE